jgi:hypothetical protein
MSDCTEESLSCEDLKLGDSQLWRRLLRKTGECISMAVSAMMKAPNNPVSGYAKNIVNTTATDVLAAGGAGVKNYITQILVTNASTSVGTLVDIVEETSGTVLYTGYAGPEGGFSVSFTTPLVQGTANKKIQAKCVTTGADVTVSISGYKI